MSFFGNHVNLTPASQSDWNKNNSKDAAHIKNRPLFIDDNGEIHKLNKDFLPNEVALKEDIRVTSVNGMTGDVVIEAGGGDSVIIPNGIYVQENEPVGAEDGALWVDLDEEVGIEQSSDLQGKTLINPEIASVGQLMMVEEVDENGTPIKWKAVDANSLLNAILPPISEEDNGKTLTVVDGTWQLI